MRVFDPDRIRKRRIELGLTQAILAERIGTAREYLIEIEKGRAVPKAPMIAKIAASLEVKEDYFFVDDVSNNLH